jgi:hypothetical protein
MNNESRWDRLHDLALSALETVLADPDADPLAQVTAANAVLLAGVYKQVAQTSKAMEAQIVAEATGAEPARGN